MSKKAKILYVEDDIYLSYVTKDNLELKGYIVVWVKDGVEALKVFSEESFDLCVVDIMLPKLDGFSVAEEIRKENEEIPILFLSAKTLKEDKIKGLTLGADDYITKPFSIEELVLKIEVFLKRSKVQKKENTQNLAELGKLYFDFENLELSDSKTSTRLTLREAELLHLFCQNKNKLLKKEEILNSLWKDDSYFLSRSLDVFVSRLRKYLKSDSRLKIETVHGVGFIFKVEI
jgi:DNA-binding response OmpR family regulator